jgi:predicted translin family RNA/ssDNA-binding protein
MTYPNQVEHKKSIIKNKIENYKKKILNDNKKRKLSEVEEKNILDSFGN